MSGVLKGLLQPQIQAVVSGFGTQVYTGPPNATAAQALFVDQLSTAIAVAVQAYLQTSVKVAPGQSVITAGGPTNQAGTTTTPGILIAP